MSIVRGGMIMSINIGRKFEFEACHFLPGKEVYGECSNLHGHRYELEVVAAGEVSKDGWLLNFKDLKELVQETVIAKYDHQNLNDYFEIPTAENVGSDIFITLEKKLKEHNMTLQRIKLNETSNCYVEITNE